MKTTHVHTSPESSWVSRDEMSRPSIEASITVPLLENESNISTKSRSGCRWIENEGILRTYMSLHMCYQRRVLFVSVSVRPVWLVIAMTRDGGPGGGEPASTPRVGTVSPTRRDSRGAAFSLSRAVTYLCLLFPFSRPSSIGRLSLRR